MHTQDFSILLFDVLDITINRKHETLKIHNRLKYVQIQKYKKFYFILFLYYIIMKPTSQNNGINAIKEAKKAF